MTWATGFADWVELARSIVALGADILVQSSVLLVLGLSVAWLLRRRGVAVSSVVLRTTLIAVVLCPAASSLVRRAELIDWTLTLPEPSATTAEESPVPQTHLASAQRDPIVGIKSIAPPTPVEMDTARPEPSKAMTPVEPAHIASIDEAVGKPEETVLADSPGTTTNGGDITAAFPEPAGEWDSPSVLYIVLSGTWLVGTAGLVLRMLLCFARFRWQRRGDGPVAEDVAIACRTAAERMGAAVPRVVVNPYVSSPLLTGIFRPTIILPADEGTDRSGLNEVLCHELAHMKRGDCLWNGAAAFVCAILFYQPLLWLLQRKLEQISEDICDDMVVAKALDRRVYARELLAIAERYIPTRPEPMVGVGVVRFRSSLGRRVQRILDQSRELSTNAGRRSVALIIAAGTVLTLMAGVVGIRASQTQQPASSAEGVTKIERSTAPEESVSDVTELTREFAEQIAAIVADVLAADAPAFLTTQDIERLPGVFRELLYAHPPKAMFDERRDAILKAFREHAERDLRSIYLAYDDAVDSLRWKLWMATQRELTQEEAKALEQQRQWVFDMFTVMPDNDSWPASQEVKKITSVYADPLSVFWDRPMPQDKWKTLIERYKSGSDDLRPPHATSTLMSSYFRTWYPPSSEDVQLPRLDGDKVFWTGMGGKTMTFGFQSNASQSNQIVEVYGHNYSQAVVLSLTEGRVKQLEDIASFEALRKWADSQAHGEIICEDVEKGVLMGVRGTRMVRLDVTEWEQADRFSDAALNALIDTYGRDTCSVADIINLRDLVPRQFAVVAVRNREGVLAVIRGYFQGHQGRDGNYLQFNIRLRPLPRMKYVTVGAPARMVVDAGSRPEQVNDSYLQQKADPAAALERFKTNFEGESGRNQRNMLLDVCHNGPVEHARYILDKHPDWLNIPTEHFSNQSYPICSAARGCQPDVLKLLLERGARVDVVGENDRQPLHSAGDSGCIEAVRMLLDHGADVNARDPKFGMTALHTSVTEDEHLAVARLLIERGADVNARVEKFGNMTPLKLALMQGMVDSARLLAGHGAELDIFTAAGLSRLDDLKRLAAGVEDPFAPDDMGVTPLHAAAIGGATDCITWLIAQGCDVNTVAEGQMGRGMTPLTVAVAFSGPDAVELLLEAGADPNQAGYYGAAPLPLVYSIKLRLLETDSNRQRILHLLLAHGVDINAGGQEGWTALHAAAQSGDADDIALLLKHGANVDARNNRDQTPLHAAVIHCNVDSVRALLTAGADVHATDKDGATPLSGWQRLGATDRDLAVVMTMLLARGADPNVRDRRGQTLLHKLVEWDMPATAEVLLTFGANPAIADEQGKTPLDSYMQSDAKDRIKSYLAGIEEVKRQKARSVILLLLQSVRDGLLDRYHPAAIETFGPTWTLEHWKQQLDELARADGGYLENFSRLHYRTDVLTGGDIAVVSLASSLDDATKPYYFFIVQKFDDQWRAISMAKSPANVNLGTHLRNAVPVSQQGQGGPNGP